MKNNRRTFIKLLPAVCLFSVVLSTDAEQKEQVCLGKNCRSTCTDYGHSDECIAEYHIALYGPNGEYRYKESE